MHKFGSKDWRRPSRELQVYCKGIIGKAEVMGLSNFKSLLKLNVQMLQVDDTQAGI
jgi:hypothetical protein